MFGDQCSMERAPPQGEIVYLNYIIHIFKMWQNEKGTLQLQGIGKKIVYILVIYNTLHVQIVTL